MFKKMMPTRDEAKPFEIIADIDAVVATSIGFKLHGKNHRIEPITTQNFLEWSSAVSNLYSMGEKQVESEALLKAYFETIHSVCKTITLEDIKKCEASQLAALFGTILDHCTGKNESEKKKMMKDKTTGNHLPN